MTGFVPFLAGAAALGVLVMTACFLTAWGVEKRAGSTAGFVLLFAGLLVLVVPVAGLLLAVVTS